MITKPRTTQQNTFKHIKNQRNQHNKAKEQKITNINNTMKNNTNNTTHITNRFGFENKTKSNSKHNNQQDNNEQHIQLIEIHKKTYNIKRHTMPNTLKLENKKRKKQIKNTNKTKQDT